MAGRREASLVGEWATPHPWATLNSSLELQLPGSPGGIHLHNPCITFVPHGILGMVVLSIFEACIGGVPNRTLPQA